MKKFLICVFVLFVIVLTIFIVRGTKIYGQCNAFLEKNHNGIDSCIKSCIGFSEKMDVNDADVYRCHGIPGPYRCFGTPYTVSNPTGKEGQSLDCDYSCNDDKLKNACLTGNKDHLGECDFLIDQCNW